MRIISLITLLSIALFGASFVFGAKKPESYYQAKWCEARKGKPEYWLPDQTRVDCLTKDYAVEFDFGRKWAEAVGQALHYALMTGKTGAIVLIIENASDEKKTRRVKNLIGYYRLPLVVFEMEAE